MFGKACLNVQRTILLEPAAHTMTPFNRVLVVDDDVDSAVCLRMLLSRLGHTVRVAYDGLTAVEVAAEFAPELVLLDLSLPKLNGIEACRRMRALPNGKTMTIVAVTGWSDEKDFDESEEAGFSRHLVKPVDLLKLEEFLGHPG